MGDSSNNTPSDKAGPAPRAVRSRAAWSLASLVLLMTLGAIVTAALRAGAVQGGRLDDELELLAGATGIGFMIGAILGVDICIARHGNIGGAFLGLVAGMGFGTVGAALCALPASMPVVLIGSVVLVGVAVAMRYFSWPRGEEACYETPFPQEAVSESTPPPADG